ncbi:unnamed protein product [Ceratitis capitata]|uniref:(Mediterranean fruit fly) hypothetical protein n=1 Tax=Ceratitis capitata TaxID=7213 RepID=A0A811UYQ3_CERCA|nr:unnamed protein product [Ceratitis capitata]
MLVLLEVRLSMCIEEAGCSVGRRSMQTPMRTGLSQPMVPRLIGSQSKRMPQFFLVQVQPGCGMPLRVRVVLSRTVTFFTTQSKRYAKIGRSRKKMNWLRHKSRVEKGASDEAAESLQIVVLAFSSHTRAQVIGRRHIEFVQNLDSRNLRLLLCAKFQTSICKPIGSTVQMTRNSRN